MLAGLVAIVCCVAQGDLQGGLERTAAGCWLFTVAIVAAVMCAG